MLDPAKLVPVDDYGPMYEQVQVRATHSRQQPRPKGRPNSKPVDEYGPMHE